MIKKNKTRAPYKQKLHLRSFAKGLGFLAEFPLTWKIVSLCLMCN